MYRSPISKVMLSLTGVLLAGTAIAGPSGGVVTHGGADIVGQGSDAVTINQNTNRVVIDWQNFDTQSHESVTFNQIDSNSIALNRILSGSPTQFDGALNANGTVIVMNGNGVVFGANARVDVNGLIATTVDVNTDSFMNDAKIRFDQSGNPNAAIINHGTITAKEAGLVGFVAPHVENSGTINARLGKVQLESGDRFTFDLYGDGLIEIAASDAVNAQLVKNSGTITADGGIIQLQASAAKNVVDALVNNTGVLEAKSFSQKNGVIKLGGTKATTRVSGTINASGKNTNQTGGRIEITGKNVIVENATIDASGTNGGGDIRIGGGYKGGEEIHRADITTVDNTTTISADATENGDGGTIVVWSDDMTDIAAKLSAKGGQYSGDGGLIETSGKTDLRMTGMVDTSATNGLFGTWLVDPVDITITGIGGASDGVNTFNVGYLESQLANIILQADNNITLNMNGDTAALTNNVSLTLDAGNDILTASNGSIWTFGTGGVTFIAGRDIRLTHQVNLIANGSSGVLLQADRAVHSTGGGSITTQGTDIILNADRDEVGGGSIELYSFTLNSNGGDIVLGGGDNPYTKAATGYAGYTDGVYLNDATLNSGAGDMFIRGAGDTVSGGQYNYGVWIENGTTIDTTSGAMTIHGVGGNGTGNNIGVYARGNGGGVFMRSVNGSIDITGRAGASVTGLSNYGVYLLNGARIQSTGAGADGATINVHATGGSGGTWGYGFYALGAASRIETVNGDVTLYGEGNNSGIAANEEGSGIVLEFRSSIRATGSADITMTGVSAIGNGTNNYGVHIWDEAFVQASTGNVSISAQTRGTGTNNIGLMTTDLGYIDAGSGTLEIATDSMSLDTSLTALDTSSDLIIRTFTDGADMGVGGGSENLQITQAMLNAMSWGGDLWLGGSSDAANATAHNIVLNGSIDFDNKGSVVFVAGNDIISDASTTLAIDGVHDFSFIAGNDIDLTNDFDISMPGSGDMSFVAEGDVEVETTNSIVVSSLSAENASLTVTGANNRITAGPMTVVNDLSLRADDMTLNGAITGGGDLEIETYNAARALNLNVGADDNSGLHLTAAEINRFADGWDHIYFGTAGSNQSLLVGGVTFQDPTVFRNIGYTGVFNTTGIDNASFDFYGDAELFDGTAITTDNQDINFHLYATFSGGDINSGGGNILINEGYTYYSNRNSTIESEGGDITIDGLFYGLDGTGNIINIDAGAGSVTFNGTVNAEDTFNISGQSIVLNGAWGNSDRLRDVTLTAVDSITLPAINADNVDVTVSGAGNMITTTGVIDVTDDLTLSSDDITIGAALSGGGDLTLRPVTLSRGMHLAYGVDDGSLYYLSAGELDSISNGWNTVNFGMNSNDAERIQIGDYTWNNDSKIFLRGRTRLNGHLQIYSDLETYYAFGLYAGTPILTAHGTDISIGYLGVDRGGSIYTNGGNLMAETFVTSYWSGADRTMTVDTDGGNILITNQIISGGNTSALDTLVLDAGSGDVTISGPVDTPANIDIVGANVSLTGTWGGTTRLGDVTMTTPNSITLSEINATNVDITVTGAGNMITTAVIDVTDDLTLTSDDITIGGALSGGGDLSIRPYDIMRHTSLNRTFNAAFLNISQAELDYMADGWSGIIFGKDDVNYNGNIFVGQTGVSTVFNDDVYFRTNEKTIIYGDVQALGDASFVFEKIGDDSRVNFNGTAIALTTQGGSVTVEDVNFLNIASDVSIDTQGGDVTIGAIEIRENLATDRDFTIDAGTGSVIIDGTVNGALYVDIAAQNITLGSAWGGTTRLGDVTLTSVDGITLPSITANSITVRTTDAASDITIGAASVLDASGAGDGVITLAAGRDFINQNGAGALVNPNGSWHIFSDNPTDIIKSGLVSDANRYGCTFSGSIDCAVGTVVPVGENVFFYEYIPTLTITADDATRIYGNANPAFTYDVDGLLGGDTLGDALSGSASVTTAANGTSDVGSYVIVAANGTLVSEAGYALDFVDGTLDVTQRQITVDANAISRVYGNNNPALTYVVGGDGLVNGDTMNGALTSVADNTSDVGDYAITQGTLDAGGNYAITYTDNDLTVTLRNLVINAQNKTRPVGDANPALTYTVGGQGLVNGDTMSGALVTVANGASAAGNYAITQGTVTVNSANYAVTFNPGVLTVTSSGFTQIQIPTIETGRENSIMIPSPVADTVREIALVTGMNPEMGDLYNFDITQDQVISNDGISDLNDMTPSASDHLMSNFYKVYFTEELLKQLGYYQ